MIPGWLNSQGVRAGGGGSGASTPQAAAYFAAMPVKPDASTGKAMDTLIKTLVDAGLFSKLIYLHLIACHDAGAAIINAVTPTGAKGAIESATFTAKKGVTTSGTSGSRFMPGIVSSTGNAASFAWGIVLKDLVQASQWFCGIYSGSGYHMHYAANPYYGYCAGDGGTYSSPGIVPDGYVATSCLNGQKGSYNNGTFSSASNSAQGPLLSQQLALGNTTGDSIGYAQARWLADFFGAGMTAAEHTTMRTALDTYFKAIGAY